MYVTAVPEIPCDAAVKLTASVPRVEEASTAFASVSVYVAFPSAPVVIVGIGNLGNALAGYPGFASRGFSVVGLFDTDPKRVGETITVAGKEILVSDISKLPQVVLSSGASIGVIATPDAAAQDVCDLMVRNGITSVLNFAPVLIEVPEGVDVRRVDLATELQILAFHEQRKSQSALTQANAG